MTSKHPFADRRTRVLSVADVRSLISMEETIEVQRAAFVAQAGGNVTASPNAWLRLPEQERRRGWLKVLAGHEAVSGSLGVKVLARFADNPPGANLGSLVLLFDDNDGFPLAIMDGVVITALRTGAGAGLATDVLGAPEPRTLGVVGTGVVAWHSVEAIMAVRPSMERLLVYSRNEERRRDFAERASAAFSLDARPVATVEEATGKAEVLVTGTNASEPVVLGGHLHAGQHVNAMGIRNEIAPEALARTWVIPDGVEEAVGDGKFSTALAAGAVTHEDLGPQLGALLAAGGPAHDPQRISLFDSSGVAVQDITMAQYLWRRAEAEGVGVALDLGLALGAL